MTEITIGGSTAAAAAGVDPWKSRVRLWAEITGRVPREEPGEWAEAGNRLESPIARWVEDREGIVIIRTPEIEDGFLLGHPDGLVFPADDSGTPPLGVYEGKTTGFWRRGEWDDDGVPIPYVIQGHVYMHLTSLPKTLLGCLVGGQKLKTAWIDYDPQLWTMLYAALEEFVGYCQRDEPPPPDGTDSTTDLLKHLYPKGHAGVVVQATAEDYQAAVELARVKAQRKAVEAEEARLENLLKLRLGDADTLSYEGQTIARWPTITGERKPSEGGEYSYRRFTVSVKS